MPLLLLAAAAGFACIDPTHHDGDAIRCAGEGRSMRLHAIDAPEMPGACRPGRQCTPGDPYAARDYLQGLTAGRTVMCEQVDTDSYGRRVVDCTADGVNLGCAMVAGGHAVERYGRLDCGVAEPEVAAPAAVAEPAEEATATQRYYAPSSADAPPALPWLAIGLWLLLVNAAAFAAMAIDKRRAIAGNRRRIAESTLLALAVAGGSAGAIFGQYRLRHKTRKQPFATRLLLLAGLQAGMLAGVLILAL
jgi:uncharacterized membrane protein YsdA (DUF1294 family)